MPKPCSGIYVYEGSRATSCLSHYFAHSSKTRIGVGSKTSSLAHPKYVQFSSWNWCKLKLGRLMALPVLRRSNSRYSSNQERIYIFFPAKGQYTPDETDHTETKPALCNASSSAIHCKTWLKTIIICTTLYLMLVCLGFSGEGSVYLDR